MKRDALLIVLFVPCAALIVLFGFDLLPVVESAEKDLLFETIPRLAAGLYLLLLYGMKGYAAPFRPKWRAAHLLWSVPCFLVAAANFPFSALIGGTAAVTRPDLIWLFLLKCFSIALLEEGFFRAFLVPLFANGGKRPLFSVLVSALLFGLVHLVNLLSGNVGAVFLQVGYTFLLGCMLAVMLLVTQNAWLCIGVHFVFDAGGMLVPDLGQGLFQDSVFWALTAACGVLCAAHIVWSLVRLCRRK